MSLTPRALPGGHQGSGVQVPVQPSPRDIMHGIYPRPVSREAGFFDSWKGDETYVGCLGLWRLCYSKDCWLPEAIHGFQASLLQMSRFVQATLT